jgi:predicted methyltransferase
MLSHQGRRKNMFTHALYVFVALSVVTLATAGEVRTAVPDAILAGVADPHRPPEQIKLDTQRKPAQLIAFAGVKPGDRIADFMPGNAYFTRIFSSVVGPKGRVYAFIPAEEIKNCPPAEIAGSRAIEHDATYRNVVQISRPIDHFATPQRLDVVWTAQNYHDLHDAFMGPANVELLNKAFFNSLKPGGTLIVIDHVAAPGSGLRDTDSLHRIDPATTRQEIEAVGFAFEGEIEDLKNIDDDHSRSIFDPSIRGKTDQFVYKFRRPEMPK